jgi:indole-3-glycerol phosphate synthase/phosphoribosylanthranilate isomerase
MNLHAVQLHGAEDFEYVQALRRELPRACEIWKAVSVGRHPLSARSGDRIVFDNGDGGTGRSFDWQAIRGHQLLGRSLIAGGIGSHNAEAAFALGAYAVDVGSAVDAMPGLKSSARIRALFERLRPPSREGLRQCA